MQQWSGPIHPLPDIGAAATPSPTFALASDNHFDNAADYDNCQIQALDFYNLNIPQRQDKPGYDQAGEAHSSVGYGQCAAVACGGVTFCPTRGPLAMRLLVFTLRGV